MLSNGLKRCPFCGGTAEIILDGSTYIATYVVARCTMCDARSKGYTTDAKEVAQLRGTEELIKAGSAWNTRKGGLKHE